MYWDTISHLDAAQRIKLGQVPAVDFLAPVGALEYYQFYWLQKLFPGGQPTLIAQWSVLISAAPLVAIILVEIDKKSRKIAFAILVPFLVFALCPTNTQSFHSYPGVNGFGIYNRHTSLLLYVLVSALVFLPNSRKLALIAALTMLALFFTKITGFLAGGLIGLYADPSGRLLWRHVLLAFCIFAVALLVLEFNHGMVSAYVESIAALVRMNEGLLLPRFLTVFSIKLDVILAAAALTFFLFWLDWSPLTDRWHNRHIKPTTANIAVLLDRDWLWIGITLVAGIFLETQNTGSQEFIFLWPALLAVFLKTPKLPERGRLIVYCLGCVYRDPDDHQGYAGHSTLCRRCPDLRDSASDRCKNDGPRFHSQGYHGTSEPAGMPTTPRTPGPTASWRRRDNCRAGSSIPNSTTRCSGWSPPIALSRRSSSSKARTASI